MKRFDILFLLVFAYVPAVFGIWDCDEDRDCRGFGANYKCNKNAAPGGQCELSGTRDEFFGIEGDLGID